MSIKFFDKVTELVNQTDKNWLGIVNGADDAISLWEAYTSPTSTAAQRELATVQFVNNFISALASYSPSAKVLAVETSLGVLTAKTAIFNNTSTVQNFAEVISAFGNLVESLGILSTNKRIEFAGILMTSYGIVMKTVADGSESIGLGSYFYDLYQAVTQKAAKAEAMSYASSLAVLLNPTADKHRVAALIDASKNNDVGIGESVAFLNHFRKLLGMAGEVAPTTPDAVFQEVTTILNSTVYQSLKGEVIIQAPANTAADARDSFGNLLSLVYLTPFSIYRLTAGAENTLKGIHSELATQWDADKLLTPAQIANGEANFSDMYLADRAAMLSWVNKRNATENTNIVMDGPDAVFRDATLNTTIRLGSLSGDSAKPNYIFGSSLADADLTGGAKADHLYGMGGNDTLNGGNGNDWLEGGTGQDTLNGGAGNDILIGGGDVDFLDGGEGNDQLKGGAGVDVYKFTGTGFLGTDTITDSDGQGVIMINDNPPLSGGNQVAGTDYVWESADHKTLYTKYDQGDGKFTLNITLESKEKIFVKDWVNGNLGIHLQSGAPVDPPPANSELSLQVIDDFGITSDLLGSYDEAKLSVIRYGGASNAYNRQRFNRNKRIANNEQKTAWAMIAANACTQPSSRNRLPNNQTH